MTALRLATWKRMPHICPAEAGLVCTVRVVPCLYSPSRPLFVQSESSLVCKVRFVVNDNNIVIAFVMFKLLIVYAGV